MEEPDYEISSYSGQVVTLYIVCNELKLTCHWKARGPVADAIYHRRVIPNPKEVLPLATLLTSKPVQSTTLQVDGLQHCEGGGVRLGLSQAAASLFTES